MKKSAILLLITVLVSVIGCGELDVDSGEEMRQQNLASVGMWEGQCAYYGTVTCCFADTCSSKEPIVMQYQETVFLDPAHYGGHCPWSHSINTVENYWHCKGDIPSTDKLDELDNAVTDSFQEQ